MSDPGDAPDPIDHAYVQAEAVLADDAERAARRARVLAAVAQASVAAPDALQPRRPAWRRSGWLVAASVAGLSLFVASQVYQPFRRAPPAEAPAPIAQNQIRNAPAAPEHVPSAPPPPPAAAPESAAAKQTPTDDRQRLAPSAPASPPQEAPAPPPQPAPVVTAPASEAAPAPSPPPPPPPALSSESASEVVVTAERRQAPKSARRAASVEASDEAVEAQDAARPSARRGAIAGFAQDQFKASARSLSDPAARLRAAAAAGRTAEIAALLEQGVPVDAPDADGDTALTKSVQADHPAAAALLRRRGASADHRNNAGESARDIAAGKDDPALSRAVGAAP